METLLHSMSEADTNSEMVRAQTETEGAPKRGCPEPLAGALQGFAGSPNKGQSFKKMGLHRGLPFLQILRTATTVTRPAASILLPSSMIPPVSSTQAPSLDDLAQTPASKAPCR